MERPAKVTRGVNICPYFFLVMFVLQLLRYSCLLCDVTSPTLSSQCQSVVMCCINFSSSIHICLPHAERDAGSHREKQMHSHAHFCILFFRFFRSRCESGIQAGFPHTSSLQVQDYIMTLNFYKVLVMRVVL